MSAGFFDRPPRFHDRREAGRVLAARLPRFRGTGALVLGVPRGGVVVAAEVAAQLGLELDVIVARKLGAPGLQELAIGAVTADGERYLNEAVMATLGVSELYLDAATTTQRKEAERREAMFRGGRPPLAVAGRTVIVVDDGLATGATVRAAVLSLRRRGPAKLVIAVPVAAADTCAELRPLVDEVVCPYELPELVAIGYYYERFESVEDEEVLKILEATRHEPAAAGSV